MPHISLTRLDLHALRTLWPFIKHAIASRQEASQAPGLIQLDTKIISVTSHATMTLWQTRKHMIAYLRAPAHLAAIKDFSSIASGKTCGYEGETLPSWSKALEKLATDGRSI